MVVERRRILADFTQAVNMSADELDAWLETPESLAVGQKEDGGESIGHASGRRIAAILRRPEAELGESDLAHIRKTIGFIRRHRAREPANMVTSRWRYSLMNWGHDPLNG